MKTLKPNKKRLLILSVASLFFATILITFHSLNLLVNFTGSLPIGIYQESKTTSLSRGDIVEICPPPTPFLISINSICPNVTFLKKIVAISNDTVQVTAPAVYINHQKIENSASVLAEKPILGTFTVPENSFYVLNNYHKRSYDSRYFGFVKQKNIIRKVQPFLVYEKHH